MDAMPISTFARKAKISHQTLRNYVAPFKDALRFLGQKGYSYNYKIVLFLCHVLVYDVADFYPDEDKEKIIVEQQKIVKDVYENLQITMA